MTTLVTPLGERDHTLGSPQSGPTLLEYGDYECPYCGRAHIEVKRLLSEVGNQIRFSFRNFPLSEIHPQALPAAHAAEAAALQGEFWSMHDLILENQRGLSKDRLWAFADTLGLDVLQFSRDLESPKVAERVKEDFMSGVRSGVNGTPTFFINGRRHDGPASFEALLAAMEISPK